MFQTTNQTMFDYSVFHPVQICSECSEPIILRKNWVLLPTLGPEN